MSASFATLRFRSLAHLYVFHTEALRAQVQPGSAFWCHSQEFYGVVVELAETSPLKIREITKFSSCSRADAETYRTCSLDQWLLLAPIGEVFRACSRGHRTTRAAADFVDRYRKGACCDLQQGKFLTELSGARRISAKLLEKRAPAFASYSRLGIELDALQSSSARLRALRRRQGASAKFTMYCLEGRAGVPGKPLAEKKCASVPCSKLSAGRCLCRNC